MSFLCMLSCTTWKLYKVLYEKSTDQWLLHNYRHSTPNTHHSPFLVQCFAYFKHKLKSTGQMQVYYTPNDFPTTKMLLFELKAVTTCELWSHTYNTVLLSCTQAFMAAKLRVPTHQMITLLLWMHLLEEQSKLQLVRCRHPEHSSTFSGVFVNTMYSHRRRDTIIERLIPCMLVHNRIPRKVCTIESGIQCCDGNKESFIRRQVGS